MDKEQFICSLNMFSGCSKEIIAEVIPLFKQNEYKEGDIIFKEDTQGEDVYIIYSGQVEIIKNYGKTNQKLLSILNEKEIFGEMGLFSVVNRTATAVAKTDSVIFSISSKQFKEIFKKFAEDGLKIVQWMLLNIGLRLEQTSKELAAINTISFLMIESLKEIGGMKIFLSKVCDEIYNTIGNKFSVLMYVDNIFTEEFELVNKCGESGSFYEQNISYNEEIIVMMKEGKKSIYYEENSGEKKFFSPMIYNDRMIGFILISTYHYISQGVKDLIISITNLVSVAIINLRQVEEEREKIRLKNAKDRYIM